MLYVIDRIYWSGSTLRLEVYPEANKADSPRVAAKVKPVDAADHALSYQDGPATGATANLESGTFANGVLFFELTRLNTTTGAWGTVRELDTSNRLELSWSSAATAITRITERIGGSATNIGGTTTGLWDVNERGTVMLTMEDGGVRGRVENGGTTHTWTASTVSNTLNNKTLVKIAGGTNVTRHHFSVYPLLIDLPAPAVPASGSASGTASTTGTARVRRGATGAAAVATTTNGTARLRRGAKGGATLTATAAGTPRRRLGGRGVASLAVTASGNAEVRRGGTQASGSAALTIAASGRATVRRGAKGSATLLAAALGRAALILRARGAASLTLTTTHRLPLATPPERRLAVKAEARRVTVPPETRIFAVPAESRRVVVEAEARTLSVPREERVWRVGL